ncbi:hypothetical protein OY671_008453, partial [Metschnikowia pulcherrima]
FDVDVAIRRGNRSIEARFTSTAGLTALFGPSGAGKTTVSDALAGLSRSERGHVTIAGKTSFDAGPGVDLPPEQRACGYVFQQARSFPHRRVRDNSLYGERSAPADRRFMTSQEASAFSGIGHSLDRWPRTSSGGEAQRVAIGRASLSGPRFSLSDEPSASLDAERRDEIMQVIERSRDELRSPILYVSHDRTEIDRSAGNVVRL